MHLFLSFYAGRSRDIAIFKNKFPYFNCRYFGYLKGKLSVSDFTKQKKSQNRDERNRELKKPQVSYSLNGLMAMTIPCHGIDPGPIPGWGVVLFQTINLLIVS